VDQGLDLSSIAGYGSELRELCSEAGMLRNMDI
jgi:hypothetical protein